MVKGRPTVDIPGTPQCHYCLSYYRVPHASKILYGNGPMTSLRKNARELVLMEKAVVRFINFGDKFKK